MALENIFNGFLCQHRVIVLFAQMAEPNRLQRWCGKLSERLATSAVAEMTIGARNSCFQMLRIGALLEHGLIIIGLYHKVVGFADVPLHIGCNLTGIGYEHERDAVVNNFITHVVGAIVGHMKWRDAEVANVERGIRLDDFHVLGDNFLPHTIVALYALMHFMGCIYVYSRLETKIAGRFDVVGMVVGDEQMMHFV